MKKGDTRRAFLALLEKNKVLLILWILGWFIALPKFLKACSLDIWGIVLHGAPPMLIVALLTFFLWKEFLSPCHELLVRKDLIERTVHVNWAKYWQSPRGLGSGGVRTCEIREGLSYHKPIPNDLIVDKRLTIGYLPKSRIILYVQKPEA